MIKHTGELMLSCTVLYSPSHTKPTDANKFALPWVPPAFLEGGGGGGGQLYGGGWGEVHVCRNTGTGLNHLLEGVGVGYH